MSALKVSPCDISPVCQPLRSQLERCAAVPWVNESGTTRPFSAEVTWRVPGTQEMHSRGAGTASLRFGDLREVKDQSRDPGLAHIVVAQWHADTVLRVTEMNRLGDYSGASAFLKRQLYHLGRYCAGLEGTEYVLSEIERLLQHSHRDWGERSRKELYISHYHTSKGNRDYRRSNADLPGDSLK